MFGKNDVRNYLGCYLCWLSVSCYFFVIEYGYYQFGYQNIEQMWRNIEDILRFTVSVNEKIMYLLKAFYNSRRVFFFIMSHFKTNFSKWYFYLNVERLNDDKHDTPIYK